VLPREGPSPAHLLTGGSLAAGFLALILAGQGNIVGATICVGVAALCDSVDGLVARLTRSEGAFGSQFDSLADLVSFGVAPALIIYYATLKSLPVVGVGACLAFVLCGGWRLARFQIDAQSRERFAGLAIPPAGVITAVLATLGPEEGVALAMVLVLSVAMVSRLPFPTLAGARRLLHPARLAQARAARAGRSGDRP